MRGTYPNLEQATFITEVAQSAIFGFPREVLSKHPPDSEHRQSDWQPE